MTEKELEQALRENNAFHHGWECGELIGYDVLAFVIHRFCGGKIEFTLGELCSMIPRLDIQRFDHGHHGGKITYITRLRDESDSGFSEP